MIFSKNRRDLNLIPEEQQSLKTRKIKLLLFLFVGAFLLAELTAFVGVAILQFTEQKKQEDLTAKTTQKNAQWQKIASTAATTKNTKIKINLLSNFAKNYTGVETSIAQIKEIIPSGITLSRLDASKEGKVTFDGLAAEPALIMQLFGSLQAKPDLFGAVNLGAVNKDKSGYLFKFTLTVKQ